VILLLVLLLCVLIGGGWEYLTPYHMVFSNGFIICLVAIVILLFWVSDGGRRP
jgi:hypothetical protein